MRANRTPDALDPIAAQARPAWAEPRPARSAAVQRPQYRAEIDGPASLQTPPTRRAYLGVRAKFLTALVASMAWTTFSTALSLPWLQDLADLAGWPLAIFIVAGIALLPGMMSAFLVTGLLLDRRPPRRVPGPLDTGRGL